jgi:arylsulfatase A-like enzyme
MRTVIRAGVLRAAARLAALLIVALATSLTTLAAAPANELPNIVIMLADDMGYGDVQALNPASKIPTPNLNRLAGEGMAFVDAHTPSAVCTPTRYGLLTGRYCWRSPLKRGVLNGYGAPLIETDRPTVASFLASQGYSTGIVGKWHLGLGFARADNGKGFDFTKPVAHGPQELGFAFSHAIPASLDFPPYVFIRNGEITMSPELTQPAGSFPAFLRRGERSADFVMENVLDDLAREAGDFIRREAKSDKPFFLYFPLTAPHKPVLPHPRFRGQTELGPYGDFVHQVDATVGAVLQALEESGAADNTLVVYTSDNGSFMYELKEGAEDHVSSQKVQGFAASHHRANGLFRGTKADVWEAGHRVPFFVRWPGQVKPGSRCEKTVCLTDLFATTAELVGAPLPKNAGPDSFSLAPLFSGGDWSTPRAPVIHHSAAGMFAIRDGKWKLVLGNGSGGREAPKGQPFAEPYALFDLSVDPAEQNNVFDDHPDVAARLEAACLKIRDGGSSR